MRGEISLTLNTGRLVGFEATALELLYQSGVGNYASQLLKALAKHGAGWQYALLASRPLCGPVPDGVALPVGRRFPIHSFWMQFVLPRIVTQLQPQLCHFTNYVAPLSLSCPFVITVHDMSLFLYSRLQPRRSLWLVRSIIPAVAKRASAIITVSRSAQRDILKVLGLPPQKVHVVYSAAAESYRVIKDTAQLQEVRRRYGLEVPFILSVSTIEPRKNLSRLVEAFAELRRQGRAEQLVLAGQVGWQYRPLLRQIEQIGLKNSVRLLGYVPPEYLPALYNLARAFAFPSLYEGFGLPALEAMACGVPVLTSNSSAMAEIGEDAAILVNPLCKEEIREGLLRLLTDDSLCEDLGRKGLTRAAQFSWDRAARETAAVYSKIAP